MSMPLLDVCNLSVGINRGNTSLAITHGINFSINTGEITALVGESGCGKTLTALSIMRLLPVAVRITSGRVVYQRASEVDHRPDEMIDLCTADEKTLCRIRGKEIAVIFQEPRQSLNPLMKIGAQIAESLELHGTDSKTAREAALDMLRTLRFPQPEKTFNAWPHQLSGGMCQRVMIAITALCRPKLLIADEPTSALDADNQKHIIALLEQINREYGTAILFITHDLSLANSFCSRSLVMHEGKMAGKGPFLNPRIVLPAESKNYSPSGNSGKPIISIRNVSCSYTSRNFGLFGKKETKPVLQGVHLDIAAGEIFGLTGESGCGKTTLARCILGLIDYEGEITVNGQAQMIFQDPGASLNPVKKIGWLMEEPLVIRRQGTAAQRSARVDAMLVRIGLNPSYRMRRVHELSGGQKQRVCIGRALMLEPNILIADEAISSLDVFAGAQILRLFRSLRESLGLTIIFITHNNEAAKYLCDKIIKI